MPRDREVKQTMSDLVELLRPSYTDEEQVQAKQIQKGYGALRNQMRAQGRLIMTVHGHPEAVMLPYQDLKKLWQLMNDLVEQAENNNLAALAQDRLKNQSSERIPLEQGLAEMREAMLGPSVE